MTSSTTSAEIISTDGPNSRVTRLRIRSINSRRPFQSQPSNVYRLILSDGNNPARFTQFDCQKTADHVMMWCGGREAAHCAGFHQISPRCWWTRNRNGSISVRRASIGSSHKRDFSEPSRRVSGLSFRSCLNFFICVSRRRHFQRCICLSREYGCDSAPATRGFSRLPGRVGPESFVRWLRSAELSEALAEHREFVVPFHRAQSHIRASDGP